MRFEQVRTDHSDSDAAVRELKAFLSEGKPAVKKRPALGSKKSSDLAAMLIHSLRTDLRDMGGLEPPEELVIERKKKEVQPKSVAAPVIPELAMAEAIAPIEPMRIMEEGRAETSPVPQTIKQDVADKPGSEIEGGVSGKKSSVPKIKQRVKKVSATKARTRKKLTGKQRLLRLLARRLRK